MGRRRSFPREAGQPKLPRGKKVHYIYLTPFSDSSHTVLRNKNSKKTQ